MDELTQRLFEVDKQISLAAKKSGRDSKAITLVAVTKKQLLEKILAYEQCCKVKGREPIFGESYVQEFKKKAEELKQRINCHLIGPFQRNKARDAVKLFDVIQSVHSKELAEALDKEANRIGKIQEIFLQVNISRDPKKSGFMPDEISAALTEMERYKSLRLTGLMTITALYDNPEDARADFRAMRLLRDELKYPTPLKLSMGMSADYPIAIEEGADIVRVGSALFE